MRQFIGALLVAAMLVCTQAALAQVNQTTGSGSAVSSVDAAADFENQAALFDNPYSENGLFFSRTNLSFNNNSCGYAGCSYAWTFPGNYMYGVGSGYFSMYVNPGQRFFGLEFLAYSGYYTTDPFQMGWAAYLNGGMIASGSSGVPQGTVLGFSSLGGFDELRYFTNDQGQSAPAFDQVRAQLGTTSTVPEPSTVILLGTGLLGLGVVAWRRKEEED